jgi:hypothetical protein
MTQFASINIPGAGPGVYYCRNKLIPSIEGDLANIGDQMPDPITISYAQGISAVVELSTQGAVIAQTSYVVMQGDMGDGVWFDMAWINYSTLTPINFMLFDGMPTSGVLQQQTRAVGTAPTPTTGSNQMPLPHRVRFIGKANVNAGSSSSSLSSGVIALTPGVLCNVLYKLVAPR